MSALIILTRPAGRNDKLAQALHVAGFSVRAWPALRIDPIPVVPAGPPQPQDFDLVVFVSGNAVRLYLPQVFPAAGRWPAHTVAATVGSASAQALLASGLFGADTTLLYPGKDAPTHDSEALWHLLQARGLPRRVLLVRGTEGRNWLADRLREAGAEVVIHPVYERQLEVWDEARLAQVRHWAASGRQVCWLMTSGASIDAIGMQVVRAGVQDWMRQCQYVITHPVLQQRLDKVFGGGATVAMVKECLPVDEAIFKALVAA